jgi:CheY-like chemotaxis protein
MRYLPMCGRKSFNLWKRQKAKIIANDAFRARESSVGPLDSSNEQAAMAPAARIIVVVRHQNRRASFRGESVMALPITQLFSVQAKTNVLLDIGLPRLDGIAVARQIRKAVPNSKILFLSQETSADVVQEAISVGGVGYVAKAKVATELLKAIEKVLLGKPFIGSGLARGDGWNRNRNNLMS